jgi:hypothetical protein
MALGHGEKNLLFDGFQDKTQGKSGRNCGIYPRNLSVFLIRHLFVCFNWEIGETGGLFSID